MARPTDRKLFLDVVEGQGGRVPNGYLRTLLGWSEEKYWRIHQQLLEDGEIERGRGYGGTVILVDKTQSGHPADEAVAGAIDPGTPFPTGRGSDEVVTLTESDLYEPVRAELAKHWALRRQLDECHCEIIARQGRRDTGGSWSRPDLAVIGSRKFEFFPERVFELHTFEVKASYDISIKGVLEALAHREAATRSYVLYHTAGGDLADFPESTRIQELAGRHGIGVIAARAIDDIEQWDEVVPALRANSDPEAVNVFIGRSLSDDAKRKIRCWFSW